RHTRFKCDWSSDVCSSDLLSMAYTHMELDLFHNSQTNETRFKRTKRDSQTNETRFTNVFHDSQINDPHDICLQPDEHELQIPAFVCVDFWNFPNPFRFTNAFFSKRYSLQPIRSLPILANHIIVSMWTTTTCHSNGHCLRLEMRSI